MTDQLMDVREPLAASRNARVEIGRDGVLHVLVGPVTLHLDRGFCLELSVTLARAMTRLAERAPERPALRVIKDPLDSCP
jgi:hypothetical protein